MQTPAMRMLVVGALVAVLTACSPSVEDHQRIEDTESGEPMSLPPTVPFPDQVLLGPGGAGLPTGAATPADAAALMNTRWRVLDPTNRLLPHYEASDLIVSLVFDGDRWSVRDCDLKMSAPGTVDGGRARITGEWEAVPDPDPGASCAHTANAGGWVEFLGSGPFVAVSGDSLLLSRTALVSPWDPGSLMPVPVAVTSTPRTVARANDAWTETIRNDGLDVDYGPLASPEDALAIDGGVLAGEVTGTTYLPEGQQHRLRIDVEVAEVFAGPPEVDPGDNVSIVIEVNRMSRERIEQSPEPEGPVLVVFGPWRDAYTPVVDGLWLQGVDGPVSPRVSLEQLAPGWTYRESVEAMVHEVRYAAAR